MPVNRSTYSLMPPNLDLTCQILISVGKLIATWANCETCFYAVYFCLAGRPNGNADVAWASILSTRRRMQLVYNLLRYDTEIAEQTKSKLFRCLEEFDAVTAIRNYYCHARYRTDEDEETLVSIDQWSLAPMKNTTDPIFRQKSRPANKETVNHICSTADRCVEISERVTKAIEEIRAQLRIEHGNFPPVPVKS